MSNVEVTKIECLTCEALRREIAMLKNALETAKKCATNHNFKHGYSPSNPNGGMKSEYRIWAKNNSSFARYGGRGITMDPAWIESFATFIAHVGPRPSKKHSLDRIDNNGAYAPGNVRWATRREQNFNTRRTRWITVRGETKTLTQWLELKIINKSTLWSRLKRGWSEEDAILTPPGVSCPTPWTLR